MKTIRAKDITVGIGLVTFFGTHTVVRIEPYTGPFDFILNVLVFSNGTKVSNEDLARYEVAE